MSSYDQRGVTLTEVLIAIVAMTAVTLTVIIFLTNYWSFSMYQQADLDSLVERLNTSDYIRENVGASSGLITQNSIGDTHVGFADPLDGTGTFWNPVHAVPGIIAMGQDGDISPVVYYKRFSIDNANNVIYNGTEPYEDEFILYLNKPTNEFMLRTLVHPATTSINKLQTSCPPELQTPACPADRILISGVASVERRYFSRSGNLIDWTSLYDSDIGQYIGPDNGAVEVLELTINVSSRAVFQKSNTTQNNTIIRIALRNT